MKYCAVGDLVWTIGCEK